MAFYYDLSATHTSNGTTLTVSEHLRLLTVANQESAGIVALYGGCRSSTAGGLELRLLTWSTPSTGGTAATPRPRDPNNPAASTTAFNETVTAGTTSTQRLAVGLAQTGGTGGWVAIEPANAITLLPNGGANGNADVVSIAVGTSVPFDATLEFTEGR